MIRFTPNVSKKADGSVDPAALQVTLERIFRSLTDLEGRTGHVILRNGLTINGSFLNNSVKDVVEHYTVAAEDHVLLVNSKHAHVNIYLPFSKENKGRFLIIKHRFVSGNNVVIAPQRGDTVDESTTPLTVATATATTLVADGVSNWSTL